MHAARRAVLIALLAAAGCESTSAERSLSLSPGATYASRPGNFTCVLPPLLGPGVRESDAADDDSAASLTVSDDFGTLLDVRSHRLTDADIPAYAGGGRPAALDAFFDAQVLPPLREQAPALAVLHRDPVQTPVGPALFAVVSLPGGSARELPAADGTVTHPDAIRGVLVFQRLRWVYAVGVQLWPPTINAPPLSPSDRDIRLLSDLRQTVARMTFN